MRGDHCKSRMGIEKKTWATHAAAMFVADWQTTIKNNPSTAYKCPSCSGWHVATGTRGTLMVAVD